METIVSNFKKIINISILILCLEAVLGVFFVTSSSFALSVGTIAIGALFLVEGLFSLIRYLYDGLANRVFSSDLVFSISSIILGLFSIFNGMEAVNVIGILMGIWFILHGGCKLYYFFALKKSETDAIYILLVISLLFLVMGGVVLFNPFSTFILITKLIGYFLIYSSVLNIVYHLMFKKKALLLLKIFE